MPGRIFRTTVAPSRSNVQDSATLPSNSLGKERDRPTAPSTGRTFHEVIGS